METIKISPQQEIFQLARSKAIEVLGMAQVYDYLPSEKAAYPFFFIGEQQSVDEENKSAVFTKVIQRIHYYSNTPFSRGTDSKHCVALMEKMRAAKKTRHYYVSTAGITMQVLPDNTTKTPLLHYVIEVEMEVY